MKKYGKIGLCRLLNIRVVLDDVQVIYEGIVENAPEQVKQLQYSKIEPDSSTIIFYVYSEQNQKIG